MKCWVGVSTETVLQIDKFYTVVKIGNKNYGWLSNHRYCNSQFRVSNESQEFKITDIYVSLCPFVYFSATMHGLSYLCIFSCEMYLNLSFRELRLRAPWQVYFLKKLHFMYLLSSLNFIKITLREILEFSSLSVLVYWMI